MAAGIENLDPDQLGSPIAEPVVDVRDTGGYLGRVFVFWLLRSETQKRRILGCHLGEVPGNDPVGVADLAKAPVIQPECGRRAL